MRKALISQPTEPDVEVRDGHHDVPAGIFEALKRRRAAPASKLVSDFEGGVSDLIQSADEASGTSRNKHDLLCPRAKCGSLILRAGVGKWVERASVQMEPLGTQSPDLAALPTPPETAQWWLITPSPMEFENVGFTRPVQSLTELGRKIKLLTCAECDLGPLGWSQEGGTEFWLACSRVAYRS
ncbi:hypothetical protein HYPSUDRAFT_145216 [Hypholoma sublateritium FD-334 SS-4]|uniref:Mss4-like protein n=1 Tax=Hypholoma sublateritium (strain FD-334 SS-4) TaxID=945553 RepID=A0A0D2KUE9_HYPSF|nr:hypothetical protein HYPSUDRAFT_145216 [Hypholoma sublateritium FD-334 SS-4]